MAKEDRRHRYRQDRAGPAPAGDRPEPGFRARRLRVDARRRPSRRAGVQDPGRALQGHARSASSLPSAPRPTCATPMSARPSMPARTCCSEKPPTPTITEFEDLVTYGEEGPRAVPDLAQPLQRGCRGRPADPQGRGRRDRAHRLARSVRKWHPARNGCGSRAASACAIRASTPCRSSPASCRSRSFVGKATLKFPANRQTRSMSRSSSSRRRSMRPKLLGRLQLARGIG